MPRTRQLLAALLLAAVPLNAQIARVAAPSPILSVVVPAAVSAAPLFTASPFSAAVPSMLALPAPIPVFSPAGPAFSPTIAPLAASAPGENGGDAPKPVAAAPNEPDAASGDRMFDGAGDLVTRSGSVFAPTRAAPASSRGGAPLVRVKPSPLAPVRAVPDTQGLLGAPLLDRVAQIAAKGQTKHEYHDASQYLFSVADNHTLNGVRGVADAYSGAFIPGTSPDGRDYTETGDKTHDGWSRAQSMNVEHGFPQSFFNRDLPMRSDLHHLMATFEHPNGMRGALPYGVVAKPPFFYRNDAGAKSDGRAFEPPDFTKGRVARLMLYFRVRYKDEPFFNTRRVAAFWNPQVETLLDWNRRFPPTVEEQRRNDQVQAFQGNRNPFVDDPRLADRIGAEALRSAPSSAWTDVQADVPPQEFQRRSDKPRKGKKRASRKRSRRGRR